MDMPSRSLSSRRQFLKSASALSVFALAPIPRAALAQDPITAGMSTLQIAAAVVTIVTGIAGLISDAQVRNKLDEISTKLDAILVTQEQILVELADLRIALERVKFDVWNVGYANKMVGYKMRYKALSQVYPLDVTTARQLRDLHDEIAQTTGELGNMGPGGFTSWSTGVLLFMLIARRMKTRAQYTSSMLDSFKKQMLPWLDPNADDQLTKLSAASQAEYDKTKANVESRLGGDIVVAERSRTGADDVDEWCNWKELTHVAVTGSWDAGYSGRQWTTEKDKSCHIHVCHIHLCAQDGTMSELMRLRQRITGAQAQTFSGAPAGVPVPELTTIGIPYIDSLNADRRNAFIALDRCVKQQFLLAQIKAFHDALPSDVKNVMPDGNITIP